ncbi:hypothetical protein KP509_04G111600 [Ceratopteris richardii]|uniref:Integrase catalytic domain-containing protein n=1 Tax=Ceratopteris richardii TaxID=49495 RepID=A0A8T2V0M3_CERRI|nr:hypothetical protein KP509_04G111600 [Ceratopteris richardii]
MHFWLRIKHQYIVPYTPQHNGVVERKKQILMEIERSMVKGQALPHSFWLEGIMCALYVLNRGHMKALQSVTLDEAWHAHKLSIAYTMVFGCLPYGLC